MTMGIYQITNNINSKLYIGSSINIEKRWKAHIRDLSLQTHHNRYLQRAWDKYGEESFIFEIIELVDDANMILEKEQYYLDFHKAYEKDNGYNNSKVAGNCTGVKHSKETKRKMSESSKGFKHTEETKMKISNAHKGKTKPSPSEKTRQKLSIAGKGRVVTEETKLKIASKQIGELNHGAILTDDNVREIKHLLKSTDLTIKEIGDYYNVVFQTISNIKRGKIWRHIFINNEDVLEDINEIYKKVKNPNHAPKNKLTAKDVISIKQMIENGMLLKSIAKMFGVVPTTIGDIKRGRTWSHINTRSDLE